jgi:hypothetical protein
VLEFVRFRHDVEACGASRSSLKHLSIDSASRRIG